MTTIKLINISITSHNYPPFFFFGVMGTLEIYFFFSRFQVYNTLTIVTMLNIRFPKLIYFITESLYPLINISPFPHAQPLITTISTHWKQ